MLVVGLTGGIACGKSTVSRQLAREGIPLVDCDLIAHETARKGTWGYRRILAAFGPEILKADGEIDRLALGQLVFSDAAARRRLNKATHMPVALELIKQLTGHWLCFRRLVVVDMPLLVETGTHKCVSMTMVVACSPEVQLQRLMLRDCSAAADAQARIDSQIPLSQKMQVADVVLMNDGSTEQLQQQVGALVAELQLRSRSWKHCLLTSPAAAAAVLLLLTALVVPVPALTWAQ